MGFLDGLKEKVRYAERWGGRRLHDFSKAARKVGAFTEKASKKVGGFAQKAAEGLTMAGLAAAAVPGVGEIASPVLGAGAAVAEAVSLGAGMLSDTGKMIKGHSNKAHELGSQMKSNKFAEGRVYS